MTSKYRLEDLIAHCPGQHSVQMNGRHEVTALSRQLSQPQTNPARFGARCRVRYKLACLSLFRPYHAFVHLRSLVAPYW
jgi:hypothetical protein